MLGLGSEPVFVGGGSSREGEEVGEVVEVFGGEVLDGFGPFHGCQ